MLVALDSKVFHDSTGGSNIIIEELLRTLYIYNPKTKFIILANSSKDSERARMVFNTSFRVDTIAKAMTYFDFNYNYKEHIDILFTRPGGKVISDVGAIYYSG